VRSLPAFRELAAIPLDPRFHSTAVIRLGERLVAVTHADLEEEHGPSPIATLLEVYQVQDGSLVGRVERQELAARIAPDNVYLDRSRDVFFDRARDVLHLLLEGGIWIEWSLAEKRTTRVRRVPWDGVGLGLSSEGELLIGRPRREPRDSGEQEIYACQPDGGLRRIAPDLVISRAHFGATVLVSPSGDRILVETKGESIDVNPDVVEVPTSRHWRLVSTLPGFRSDDGAFSRSGERLALLGSSGGDDTFYRIELFDLPP
jgi:hypothetical protein